MIKRLSNRIYYLYYGKKYYLIKWYKYLKSNIYILIIYFFIKVNISKKYVFYRIYVRFGRPGCPKALTARICTEKGVREKKKEIPLVYVYKKSDTIPPPNLKGNLIYIYYFFFIYNLYYCFLLKIWKLFIH